MKKQMIILLVGTMLLITACSNAKQELNTEGTLVTETSKELELSKKMVFMNYSFFYDENSSLGSSKYGYVLKQENYTVFIDSPASIGTIHYVTDLGNITAECEKYVYKELEASCSDRFNSGCTVQHIEKEEKVEKENYEYLLIEGTFENKQSKTDIPYIASYMLYETETGNFPVFVIALQTNDNIDEFQKFTDKFFNKIEKEY